MMNCQQLQQCIDDYLDGVLPAGEQHLAESHLAGCETCRQQLHELQELRHALRSLPVPSPSPDFTGRVLRTARHRNRKVWHLSQQQIWGTVTAMAASLVIWIGVTLYQPASPPPGIDAIVMGISETRQVKLVFNAPENLHQVSLQLDLSGNIELDGFAGQRVIEWQTALKKGANSLVLPITATGPGKAEVIARLKHQGKTRVFRIPLTVQNPDAVMQSTRQPVSV